MRNFSGSKRTDLGIVSDNVSYKEGQSYGLNKTIGMGVNNSNNFKNMNLNGSLNANTNAYSQLNTNNLSPNPSISFKSVFDKEGNPFKYFKDIKKHLGNMNSSSLFQ